MAKGNSNLDPEARAAVVRETFEAVTAVGFMKWKAEELARGNELTEEDRRLYFREFEKNFFADFQQMAAHAPDARLLDAHADWIDKADKMGLKEWQEAAEAARHRSVLGYPLPEPPPNPTPEQDRTRGR